jgi:hypothetical protein
MHFLFSEHNQTLADQNIDSPRDQKNRQNILAHTPSHLKFITALE